MNEELKEQEIQTEVEPAPAPEETNKTNDDSGELAIPSESTYVNEPTDC